MYWISRNRRWQNHEKELSRCFALTRAALIVTNTHTLLLARCRVREIVYNLQVSGSRYQYMGELGCLH